MTAFVPRTIRDTEQAAAWASLREGIPTGMSEPLLGWVFYYFHHFNPSSGRYYQNKGSLRQVGIDLRLDVDSWDDLTRWMRADQDLFVNVIDWCLHRCTELEDAVALEVILRDGSSAWKMARRGEAFELQRRVDPTVEAVVQTSAPPETAAYHHLAEAWSYLHSQNRDPRAAYSEAVLAAEYAVGPVVIPNDQRPSLGKAINCMSDAPQKWVTALGEDGVKAVIAMMMALQRANQRHANADGTRPIVVSQAEAEAAVHLAANICHWFTSGAVTRAV
jgi:hypothetical protein